MYGNILSVFGGPDESRLAFDILTANHYQPEQIGNTFFYQSTGEDASFALVVQFREAGLHFTQVFINSSFGSFLRSGGLSKEEDRQLKSALLMPL